MMRKLIAVLVGLGVIAAIAGWVLSRPMPLPDDATAGLTGDAARARILALRN